MLKMGNNVVIIGGGLGGLFTGAILAKEGFKVSVVEKNPIIGGGLQSFQRWGLTYETGMHILGGLRKGGSIHKICSYLGILPLLHLKDVDDDCSDEIHYASDNATYRIRQGKDGFVDSLAEHFKEEKENLSLYVDHLYKIADEVDFFYLRTGGDELTTHSDEFFISADDLISKHINNHQLRDILAYMNPMYGGVEGHTPAYIHALINVLYIEGASRFVGGSQQMAEALKNVIEAYGGNIYANSKVINVNVENKEIVSIEDQNGKTYSGDWYISSVHPCTLLSLLPEGAVPKAYVKRLNSIPNTYSAFTVFLKIKSNTFPYINHTCYYQDDYGSVWNYGQIDDAWPHGFMMMTPPIKDQGEYTEKIIVTCPMSFEEVRKWENSVVGKRPKGYKMWKEERTQRLLDKLQMLFPQLKSSIEKVEAASPLTIRDYYGVKEGSMYGFRKDCRNIMLSQIPPVTKIKNLILTGQNINLHGICGVPLTAVGTAEILLGRDKLVEKINKHYTERYGNN